MGRIGISLLDVEKAALQLQGRGKNPTVDNIRELLGTGSKSTIIQHLKVWKSKSDEAQGKLPQEILALITGLWERLNSSAEQRIIEIEQSTDKQIQELRQASYHSQKDNTELKAAFHQLEEILSVERQNKAKLDKQFQLEQQEHAALGERYKGSLLQLEDHKAENHRLHQLAGNIQANLEHYQNAMQQIRSEQNLIIEKQQAQFQQELRELQHELSLHRKKSSEFEQQSIQTNRELEQLKQHYHLLQQDHENQSQQFQQTNREQIILKERCDQYQNQLKTCKNEIIEINQQLIEFEKQAAILIDQRDRLQKNLIDHENKIEILRQEKLFLVQEKFELQGYIKQLS